MSNKEFINNLNSTYADVRRLDVKKINLKGKNILEYIEESVPTIKHSQDTREIVTENDLWGQWVETKDDETVVIHDDEVTNPNASNNSAWDSSIIKVEDNKAYTDDTTYKNIQTEKIKNGYAMFYGCSNLESFTSDLSSLTNGYGMFYNCANLTTFTSDLPSLMSGYGMFLGSKIETFTINLPSLTNGRAMFGNCANLTTFTSDLSSLTNGYQMFTNCSNLESFTSDLSSLTNGYQMFLGSKLETLTINLPSLTNGRAMFKNCPNLTTFSSELGNLTNGYQMFDGCSNLESFTSDLSSLTNGYGMFNGCSNLASFSSELPSLTYGYEMFYNCSNLTTFFSDLSSLTNGRYMFSNCTNLTTFSSDLSSLTNGNFMFNRCTNLTTFSFDLSSLTNGNLMFNGCTNLTSFSSDLSSLTDGSYMFWQCSLDAQSVMYIANSIKDIIAEKQLYIDGTIPYVTLSDDVYSASKGFMEDGSYVYTYNNTDPYTTTISASSVGLLTLGINVTNNADTIQQQLEDFAKEAYFDSWAELKQEFVDKGWTVTFQYGGTDTSITYGLRDGEQIIPCPIFAKLVEADKDSAEYCTEDALAFYNIEWGHDVTDTSSYTQFNSLEDAMTSWNVFPKENIITTEE